MVRKISPEWAKRIWAKRIRSDPQNLKDRGHLIAPDQPIVSTTLPPQPITTSQQGARNMPVKNAVAKKTPSSRPRKR
ncbi:hypothetical protein CL632_00910 [bacterium]|nr:hypothetical protein [bacterium]